MFIYFHPLDKGGGSNNIVAFLRIGLDMFVDPSCFPASGEADHQNHLALVTLGNSKTKE